MCLAAVAMLSNRRWLGGKIAMAVLCSLHITRTQAEIILCRCLYNVLNTEKQKKIKSEFCFSLGGKTY